MSTRSWRGLQWVMRTFRVGIVRATKGPVRIEVQTTVRAAGSYPRSRLPPRSRGSRSVTTAVQIGRQRVAMPGV
jgi:hypothetical protein